MNKEKYSLGQKIRYRRKELKLSQEELAERLSVTRQMITNYERDCVDIKMSVFLEIAAVLEVSPAWFFSDAWERNLDEDIREKLKRQNIMAMYNSLPQHFKDLAEEQMMCYVLFMERYRLQQEREDAK